MPGLKELDELNARALGTAVVPRKTLDELDVLNEQSLRPAAPAGGAGRALLDSLDAENEARKAHEEELQAEHGGLGSQVSAVTRKRGNLVGSAADRRNPSPGREVREVAAG